MISTSSRKLYKKKLKKLQSALLFILVPAFPPSRVADAAGLGGIKIPHG